MKVTDAIGRRDFISGGLALAAASALPAPAFAKPLDTDLLNIARRELERAGRTIWLKDMVGLADFSRPSSDPRFFVLDMVSGKVRSYLVAHGRGSDPEHDGLLKHFSNEFGSEATSRGAYLTHTWYQGKHGPSMRLAGLEPDNNNAEARAIVVHGAWYANPSMVTEWGKLGRSEGCLAVPEANLMEILARLGPGRMVFADRL